MALGFTTSATYGSRTVLPDRGLTKTSSPRVLIAKFGDGYEQRLVDGINSIEEQFNVTFNNRSAEEIDDIMGYLASLKGVTSFTYTIPNQVSGGELAIKVVCDQWSQVYHHDGYYSATANFRRVYEA